VANIIQRIKEMKLPTIHLISIGGWNSPHPDTSNPVEQVYNTWLKWNNGLFDGFDWDIEGNDDMDSPYNHFTLPCLNLMGRMSQLAKQDGYIVAMAPAESYCDPTTSAFDLDLDHSYPEWVELQPNFKYHGHNVYTYLLTRYGTTSLSSSNADLVQISNEAINSNYIESNNVNDTVDTFDFVTIQLYEGYSHAEYNTTIMIQSAADYITQFVQRVSSGWDVNYPSECFSDIADSKVSWVLKQVIVPHTRLVVGLANGWAGDGKFLLIYPDQVRNIYYLCKRKYQYAMCNMQCVLCVCIYIYCNAHAIHFHCNLRYFRYKQHMNTSPHRAQLLADLLSGTSKTKVYVPLHDL
jgi:hypothetical protein